MVELSVYPDLLAESTAFPSALCFSLSPLKENARGGLNDGEFSFCNSDWTTNASSDKKWGWERVNQPHLTEVITWEVQWEAFKFFLKQEPDKITTIVLKRSF